MKATIQKLIMSATALYVVCGDALARPCGLSPLPACEVPEPSTLPLMIVAAVAVAVFVAKKRK